MDKITIKAGDLVKDKQGAIREVIEIYDDGWVDTIDPNSGHDGWLYPVEELEKIENDY